MPLGKQATTSNNKHILRILLYMWWNSVKIYLRQGTQAEDIYMGIGGASETSEKVRTEPLSKEQVGGSHYSDMAIQPVDYIVANAIPYLDGNVIKYISRHRSKNGAEDVRKAIHYCEMILRTEYPNG